MGSAKWFLVAAALFSTTAFAGESDVRKLNCNPKYPIEPNVTIAGGVDGDTVHIKTKAGVYSVRLLNIDTPETHYLEQNQGPWAQKAAQRMQELLPNGTAVRLEFDKEMCDANKRVLAHLFKGNMHINKQMVKEGFAVNYCIAPNLNHCDELTDLVEDNLAHKRGFLGDPSVEIPYMWRKRVSNRPFTSYVGNLRTKNVYLPGHEDRVPVGERVFFFTESAVKAPYHVVE